MHCERKSVGFHLSKREMFQTNVAENLHHAFHTNTTIFRSSTMFQIIEGKGVNVPELMLQYLSYSPPIRAIPQLPYMP